MNIFQKDDEVLTQETTLIGKTFVLGRKNASGHFVMVLNNRRYLLHVIEAQPGDRVRVTKESDDGLTVVRIG